MPFIDASDCGQNLAGGAISALERIMIDEGLLHGVKRSVGFGQTFDRHNRAANHDGQCQAGEYALSVNEDRTGPALSVVAALLGTCHAELVT